MRLDRQEFAQQGAHAFRDAERRQHAERGADQSGEDRVGRSLGDELLDELPAMGPDRAGHAHLGAALRRQHREDQDDQEDACRDREETEDQEQAGEHAREVFRHLDGVRLGDVDAQVLSLECRAKRVQDRSRVGIRITHAAGCRDRDAGQRRRLVRHRLEPLQRHHHADGGLAVTRERGVRGDIPDDQLHHLVVVRDRQGVADLRVQDLGGLLADHDLAIRDRGEVDRAAVRRAKPVELLQPGRVDPRQDRVGLRLAGLVVHNRDANIEKRHDAVDVLVSRERFLGQRQVTLVDVLHQGGHPVGREVGASQDQRVDVAELAVDVGRRRVMQRVADAQRRRDDQRREHQADDDQGGLRPAPRDIPDAELEEDGPSPGDEGDEEESEREHRDQRDEDGRHRYAEDVVHDGDSVLSGGGRGVLVGGDAVGDLDVERGRGVHHMPLDLAVTHVDDAVGLGTNVGVVRHDHQR